MRVHSLLVTGDGKAALKWGSTNAYTEDANGKPVYDWTITDRIFDTYMERKMKPLVQIGFMPQALSSHPEPYRHHWKPGDNYNDIYTGWAYPPKDYDKWGGAGLPVGAPLRSEIRQGGSGVVAVGGLERAEYRVLEGYAGGVSQALRLLRPTR